MFTKCICTPSFLSCPGEFTEQKTDRRAASHICCALWNPVSLFFRRHLPHRSRVPNDSGRFFIGVSLFVVSFIISFPVDIPVFYSTGQVILKTVYHFYSILISFTYQVFSMLSAVFAPNLQLKRKKSRCPTCSSWSCHCYSEPSSSFNGFVGLLYSVFANVGLDAVFFRIEPDQVVFIDAVSVKCAQIEYISRSSFT